MTLVKFFIDQRGKNPVGEFLDENKNIKIKAMIILHNITEFGLVSVIPHIKKLSGLPLWEIRILGKTNVRILFALYEKGTVLVLHGFIKKTTRTPRNDLKTALDIYTKWKNLVDK